MATSTIQMRASDPEYTTTVYPKLYNLHARAQGSNWQMYGYNPYTSAAFDGSWYVTLGIAKSGYTPVGIAAMDVGEPIERDPLDPSSEPMKWQHYEISGNNLVLRLKEEYHGHSAVTFPDLESVTIKYIKD